MKKSILIFIIFLAFFIFNFKIAQATTIFSPIIEMEMAPGEIKAGVVKIYNETDEPVFLNASIERFTSAGEGGQPQYIPIDQQDLFLDWFKLSATDLVLQPSQVSLVPFTVSVPANTAPGGYYAVIFWQNISESNSIVPNSEKTVQISGRVGTLVLITVAGQVIEQGSVLDFAVYPDKKYFFSLPINFSVRFENSGNIHLKPSGEIKLTNWLGYSTYLPINPTQRNVLPQSIRRFEAGFGEVNMGNWLEKQFFGILNELRYLAGGKYKATLNLNYGSVATATAVDDLYFWLIPYRLIIAVITLVLFFRIFFKINKKIKNLSGK